MPGDIRQRQLCLVLTSVSSPGLAAATALQGVLPSSTAGCEELASHMPSSVTAAAALHKGYRPALNACFPPACTSCCSCGQLAPTSSLHTQPCPDLTCSMHAAAGLGVKASTVSLRLPILSSGGGLTWPGQGRQSTEPSLRSKGHFSLEEVWRPDELTIPLACAQPCAGHSPVSCAGLPASAEEARPRSQTPRVTGGSCKDTQT